VWNSANCWRSCSCSAAELGVPLGEAAREPDPEQPNVTRLEAWTEKRPHPALAARRRKLAASTRRRSTWCAWHDPVCTEPHCRRAQRRQRRPEPDDLGDTLDEQAAGCGLEARKLAAALRRKHQAVLWRTLATAIRLKHGVGEVNTGWDYAEHLESTLRRAEKAKEERRERRSQHRLDFQTLMAELTIDIDELQSSTPEHH